MKKILKWLGIILILVLLLGIGGVYFLFGSGGGDPAKLEVAAIDDETLQVIGEVDKKTGKEFLRALQEHPQIKTIKISSGGGDVDESIKIAKEIHNRKIELLIENYCFSSCLNYFVPAAAKTTIEPNAILGFHGSPQTFPQPIKLFFGKQVKNEKTFFKQIDLPENILIKLAAKRDAFSAKNNTEGMTFWMVDKFFFEENGLELNPISYFPSSQAELDKDVQRVLANPHVYEDKLVMYGDFN